MAASYPAANGNGNGHANGTRPAPTNGARSLPFNGSHANGHGEFATRPLTDWGSVIAALNQAQDHSAIGDGVPELAGFRGLKRRLAKFVAKIVLYMSRMITNKQRVYNVAVLNGVRDLVAGLRQLEVAQRDALGRVEAEYQRRLAELEKLVTQMRTRLPMHEHRVTMLLEEVRRRMPGPMQADQVQNLAAEYDHSQDGFYVAFEDQFRGSREDIKQRLRDYLPLLREAGVGTPEMPILDVGCGRGEWLELLRDEGFQARGVDLNRVLVDQCQQYGFDVVLGDVISHLKSLPDASVGAVTGFHIIEHLPFDVLVNLFDETVRVLKPGGLALFETPNPECMLVGSTYFYCDPTHRNPLFPPTVQFLAEYRGFVKVDIVRPANRGWTADPLSLLPENNPLAAQLNPVIHLLKSRLYAAPDFAVVGRKAA